MADIVSEAFSAVNKTATVNTLGKVIDFKEVVVSEKFELIKRAWASLHNAIILCMLFTMLGIAIGVHVSKTFYSDKMQEVITTGALLYKAKVYTIVPKL